MSFGDRLRSLRDRVRESRSSGRAPVQSPVNTPYNPSITISGQLPPIIDQGSSEEKPGIFDGIFGAIKVEHGVAEEGQKSMNWVVIIGVAVAGFFVAKKMRWI